MSERASRSPRPGAVPVASLGMAVLLVAWAAGGAGAAGVIRVPAGGSIAAALERAEPGTTIEVEPGVYHEALTVDTPGITLRGLVRGDARPVLDGKGELNDGVIASGSPFTMTGFGVRRYKGNGVAAQGVDGVFLSDLVVDDTGLYGVYPIQSRDVTVTHCTITRITDAGIYVGQSNRVLVAHNEVHHNVAGIEIENTNDAVVRDNLAYENTAGILVFALPGKVQKEARRTRVVGNWVLENDVPNFGDPSSVVGRLPPGIGIMVMGADDTVVRENRVLRNDSAGILLVRLDREQAGRGERLEPFSDRTRIGPNHVRDNGLRPAASFRERWGAGADLVWDGTGEGNCASLPDAAAVAGPAPGPCPEAPGEPAGGEATPAPSEAAPAPSEATPAAPSEATPGAAAPMAIPDGAAVVRIRGMRFAPKHLTVAPGRTVAWVNEDAVTHTVTSGKGTAPVDGPLGSPFLSRGQVYQHTFDAPGRHEYLCLPHVGQIGMREATVTVRSPHRDRPAEAGAPTLPEPDPDEEP